MQIKTKEHAQCGVVSIQTAMHNKKKEAKPTFDSEGKDFKKNHVQWKNEGENNSGMILPRIFSKKGS